VALWTLVGPIACFPPQEGPGTAAVGPEEVRKALKQAVEFFRTQVSTSGGYHFRYASDLSYGRSEAAEGPSQVTVQTGGTPRVGMAYLRAYEATEDPDYLEAARDTALLLVRGQHCSGGWDYIIELDPEKRRSYPYRVDGDCAERQDSTPEGETAGPKAASTLDDNVTQGALRLLMRVDRELGFQDPKIHEASLYALDQLARAQYPNGAWPQRFQKVADPGLPATRSAAYPDSWSREWPGPDYRHHYTLNDNAILDVIDTFLEAARIYGEPRYRAVAEKGGDFLLLAQMPDPQPAWAQQYDGRMHPAWGRIFEPPSITGSESQAVLQMLLVLYRETGRKKYLEPVPRAVEYLRKSNLPPEGPWRREGGRCGPEELCLARFYELGTNRPLFITKGSRVRVETGSSRLLDGYELSYSPQSVITHYGLWTDGSRLEKAEQEYRSLLAQDPTAIRRPERLQGLSPWRGETAFPSGQELSRRVRSLVQSMDPRGAWVEEGSVGKADPVIFLFAAENMVVTVGDRTVPLNENGRLNVFRGDKPPLERIISSRTFARNIETMAAFLSESGR
jgi:PelA/Pel-15E family pectate lyase